jgi:hypothetical protein
VNRTVLGFVVATSVGMLSGCTEDVAPAASPIRQVTLPVGNWAEATNVAHYKAFASHDEAASWFDTFKTSPAGVLHGDSKISVVAESDPRYADVHREVDAIWAIFKALFPRDTEGLELPRVLLLDNAKRNAFAVFDRELGLLPHAFMINTGLLKSGSGDVDIDGLRGVIAHELAHHVLKHGWDDNHEKVNRFYLAANATGAQFGFEQTNDPALSEGGNKFIELASVSGDWPVKAWNGFPRANGVLGKIKTYIHNEAKKKNAAACATAEQSLAKVATAAAPIVADGTSVVPATAAELKALDAATREYLARELTCTNVLTDSLVKMAAAFLGTTEAAVLAELPDETKAAMAPAKTAYEAVARITVAHDAALIKIPVDGLRYYSTEEEADDVSVNVLLRLEGANPNGMGAFFRDGMDDAARAKCDAEIASGEPKYGRLSDGHHATCWRMWHVAKLVTYLRAPGP